MVSRAVLTILVGVMVLAAAACRQSQGATKVLIGATTIAEPGAQPIDDSIVIIAGNKIRSVGMRKDVPVPQASDRTDLAGKWIVPAAGSRVAAREAANLLILDRAPNGITPASPGDIGARIVAGEWVSAR